MSLQVDLTVVVNNDASFAFDLTYNGLPVNLTGCTVTVYLKASRTASDGSGLTFSTPASGVTFNSQELGKVTWALPKDDNATSGTLWYRLDVLDTGSFMTTYFFGNFNVLSA